MSHLGRGNLVIGGHASIHNPAQWGRGYSRLWTAAGHLGQSSSCGAPCHSSRSSSITRPGSAPIWPYLQPPAVRRAHAQLHLTSSRGRPATSPPGCPSPRCRAPAPRTWSSGRGHTCTPSPSLVTSLCCKRLIGKVVQSRRRPSG